MKRLFILFSFIIIIIVTITGVLLFNKAPSKTGHDLEILSKNPNGLRQAENALRKPCNRIISLAPSITEVLFALSVGDRVVGVTNFCDYPAEAMKKAKVGGYYDTSYETILTLEPDLVIILIEHEKQKEALERMGIQTLVVDQRDIAGIMRSIEIIAKVCNKEERARQLLRDIKKRLMEIKKRIQGLPRPRVMVCIGRAINSGGIEDVYICGRKGFYNECITLGGGG